MRDYENRIAFFLNVITNQALSVVEELTKDFLEIKMISIQHAIYHAIASLPEVDSNLYHL